MGRSFSRWVLGTLLAWGCAAQQHEETTTTDTPPRMQEHEETTTTDTTPRMRECHGELTRDQILSVVGASHSQIRECYERRLAENDALRGTVNVAVLVDHDGSVDRSRVGGSLGDPEVFACVGRVVDGWRFAPPSGGCVQVNVPFALSPSDRAATPE